MQRRKITSPPNAAGSTTSTTNTSTTTTTNANASTSTNPTPTATATVVRRTFGTGPFDKYWLNMDCCGLFCAGLTYALHFYGVYAVTSVLIPPWMSYTIEGTRSVSIVLRGF